MPYGCSCLGVLTRNQKASGARGRGWGEEEVQGEAEYLH